MAEAPPDQAIPGGIGLRCPPHRIGESGNHHHGAVQQGNHRNDRGGRGAESNDRDGAGVGAIPFGHVKRGKEIKHANQSAHCHEDNSEIKEGMRQEREVGGHHHIGLAGDDNVVYHDGPREHHAE